GAGGDTGGQRVRRDRSGSSGSTGRFARCDTDSGQRAAICQRVQVRGGARHLVSARPCRAIARRDLRTLNDLHWRSDPPEVVATTRATAPRHRGSSRARNRRTTDDDCLAEERRLALTVDGERLQDPLLALGLWGSTSPAVTVVAHR